MPLYVTTEPCSFDEFGPETRVLPKLPGSNMAPDIWELENGEFRRDLARHHPLLTGCGVGPATAGCVTEMSGWSALPRPFYLFHAKSHTPDTI